MARPDRFDRVDGKILRAMIGQPRATISALADLVGLSRNTVQARLSRWDQVDALDTFERRIRPDHLGYPLTAFVLTNVKQRLLGAVGGELAEIPEVIEVTGLSGVADLLIQVVARDADDLYRIAGQILGIKGVKRTSTALVMRDIVHFRMEPLIRKATESSNG